MEDNSAFHGIYGAILGYGFYVDSKKYKALPDEEYFRFFDSDFYITIDNCSDDAPVFFGLIKNEIHQPNYITKVSHKYNHDDLIKMLQEYKSIFPNEENYMPHDYLILCVD